MDEALMSLASTAGRTLVVAASGDGWEAVKRELTRLFEHGGPAGGELVEGRLEEARAELARVPAGQAELVRERVALAWQRQVLDLLERRPELAGEIRALVEQVTGQVPAGGMSVAGPGATAGRDMNITASNGGVAAAVIDGGVTLGNPTSPGPARPWPRPENGTRAPGRWVPTGAGWRLARSSCRRGQGRRPCRCGWRLG
jgi:hypothetical protein